MSAVGVPAILGLFDIGPLEFLVLIGAAVMLFGGDLPDVARKAGRMVRKLKTLANEAAKNLDMPKDLSRLPGAAEFKEGLESDPGDDAMDLDLRKQIDIDWREVARLPDTDAPSAPRPVAPAAPAPQPDRPAPGAKPDAPPAAAAPDVPHANREPGTATAPRADDAGAR